MKKYIKKFNNEYEYKHWLNTQVQTVETEVGSLTTDGNNLRWFSSDKDLYIPLADSMNYLIIGFCPEEIGESNWFPITAFDRKDNYIIIPIYLINSILDGNLLSDRNIFIYITDEIEQADS